ncbi:MAG: SpoIIE family protein phosphatase [Clostridiales bacterium]|jgi:stage II sporulation protein E|nr:SpoIIE family protein phosphatase [Clostridiales bacterium]
MFKTSADRADSESPAASLFTGIKKNAVDAGLALACFFLGRAQIFGTLSPMAVAATVPVFLEGPRFYIFAALTLAGAVTRFDARHTIKYIIAVGVLWFINICLQGRLKKADQLTKSAAAGVVMLLAGLVPAVLRGLMPYTLMICVLEGVLAFSLSFILSKGREALLARNTPMTSEELMSVAFLLSGVIMGAADIWLGMVSFRYLLCTFLTLLMISKASGAVAAAMGLVLGILMHATGYEEPGFAVSLSVSALICQFINGHAKPIMGAVFTALMSVTALYFGFFSWERLVSYALAAGLFSLLPTAKILPGIGSLMTPAGISAQEYYKRAKGLAAGRLVSVSEAFKRLASVFGGVYKPRTGFTRTEVNNLLDDVIARSCSGCVKNVICWDQNFHETYRKAYEALENCDALPDTEGDIGPFFEFCVKSPEFYSNIRYFFEMYKNDLKWRNYLNESRLMASEQLLAASVIIGDLAGGMDFKGRFDWAVEKKLRQALLKAGVEVSGAVVTYLDGRCEAEITHKPCVFAGYKPKCQEIADIASEVLDSKMKKNAAECCARHEGAKYLCRLTLSEEHRLSVSCGVARETAAKSGESGDSYSHFRHKNDRVVLVLSDGMGTGRRAQAESRATVELFEEFMESGFEKNLAVRLINSALLLKSTANPDRESFSTLDICSIDLHTGRAEFLKVGASSTFIISGDAVESISSYSLPVGILESVEPDGASRRLKHGDIVIMTTDGVLDNVGDAEKERWVVSAIRAVKSSNPQIIADHLLDEAKKSGEAKDDMTILAARVWEKI